MPQIIDVDAGRAIGYLLAHVKGSVLAELLGQSIIKDECETVAVVVPESRPVPSEYNQGIGGGANAVHEWLAACIFQYVHSDERCYVLLEDSVSIRGDHALAGNRPSPILYFENGIIWPVGHSVQSVEQVDTILKWACGYRDVVMFTEASAAIRNYREDVSLTKDDLNAIVSNTNRLITDAFDGDGYVMWKRRRG